MTNLIFKDSLRRSTDCRIGFLVVWLEIQAGFTEVIGHWKFTVEVISFPLDENEHKQKTTRYFHPALFYCYKFS